MEAGDAMMEAYPGIVMSVRANRAFLARAVRFLAAEAEIRQFRVVYVDYDPVVLSHARALLTSSTPGTIDYLDADLRDPQTMPTSSILVYRQGESRLSSHQPTPVGALSFREERSLRHINGLAGRYRLMAAAAPASAV